MDSYIFLSIIIPVYNSVLRLRECIDSICRFSYSDIEILLIDDGSNDGSEKICDFYADEYEYISSIHEKNSGASFARNKGIEIAKGEYILFLDSDDWIDGRLIECAKRILLDDNIDLLIFGFEMIDGSGNSTEYVPMIPDGSYKKAIFGGDILNLFRTLTLHNIGTKIYKKKNIIDHNIRFKNEWSYYEDIYFCLSFYMTVNSFYIINKPYYKYYIGNEYSLFNNISFTDIDALYQTFFLLGDLIPDYSRSEYYHMRTEAFKSYIEKINGGKSKWLLSFWDRFVDFFCDEIMDFISKYERIALYGIGKNGIKILEKAKKRNIRICFCIDRKSCVNIQGIKIYKPTEKLPKVNLIAITAIADKQRVIRGLKGIENIEETEIITLDEIVFKNLGEL